MSYPEEGGHVMTAHERAEWARVVAAYEAGNRKPLTRLLTTWYRVMDRGEGPGIPSPDFKDSDLLPEPAIDNCQRVLDDLARLDALGIVPPRTVVRRLLNGLRGLLAEDLAEGGFDRDTVDQVMSRLSDVPLEQLLAELAARGQAPTPAPARKRKRTTKKKLPGGIYRAPSGIWYGKWRCNELNGGKPMRPSLRTRDEAEAWIEYEKWITKKRAQQAGYLRRDPARALREQTIGPRIDRVLAAMDADGCRSMLEFTATANQLRPTFAKLPVLALGDPKRTDIIDFVNAQVGKGRRNATINGYLYILSRAVKDFPWASFEDEGTRPPVFPRRSSKGNGRKGSVTGAEVQGLVQALRHDPFGDYRALAEVSAAQLYMPKTRKQVLREVTWDEVNWSHDPPLLEIDAERTKTERITPIPLVGPLLTLFKRRWLAKQEGCALVFHVNGEMLPEDFRKPWRRAMATAGLMKPKIDRVTRRPVLDKAGQPVMVPRIVFHQLRASASRAMGIAGVRPAATRLVTGHQSEKTFNDHYNPVELADEIEAAEKTWTLDVLEDPKLVQSPGTVTEIRPSSQADPA